jgi:hypothetical protein
MSEAAEHYLEGRKNEFFYLVEIKKEYNQIYKRVLFDATYSDGFGTLHVTYYLGENVPTIIKA